MSNEFWPYLNGPRIIPDGFAVHFFQRLRRFRRFREFNVSHPLGVPRLPILHNPNLLNFPKLGKVLAEIFLRDRLGADDEEPRHGRNVRRTFLIAEIVTARSARPSVSHVVFCVVACYCFSTLACFSTPLTREFDSFAGGLVLENQHRSDSRELI